MALDDLIASGTSAEVATLYHEAVEQARAGFALDGEPEVCLVDTETTGFSPDKDELIEVALVRMRGAEVLATYDTLIRPARPLPPEIVELTGITDADLEEAPALDAVVGEIREFIGDRDLVAHNAAFDRGFIETATGALPGGWCDSLTFLRLGLPRLTSYASSDLIAAVAPERHELVEGAHRASVDTQALALIWRVGLAAVALLPLELLRVCGELLAGCVEARWLETLIKGRASHSVMLRTATARSTGSVAASSHEAGYLDPATDAQDDTVKRTPSRDDFDLAALRKRQLRAEKLPDEFYDAYEKELVFPGRAEITADLSADGVAGAMYPAFERRWEQQEMARRVAAAQEASEHLVVEAGTGVGKSLAYLVCAARLARANSITVGVATKTNALTDQLLYHELPRLSAALGTEGTVPLSHSTAAEDDRGTVPPPVSGVPSGDLRYVALKGYEHYPCLRKIDAQLRGRQGGGRGERGLLTGINVANLLVWVAQTPWGDFDNFNFPAFGAARRSICASSADCTKRKCRHYRHCYVHGPRRRARSAHIVVTNHSLLFRDLLTSGGILPPVRYWIIDEAHSAESEARRQLSVSLSEREMDSLRVLLGKPDGSGALAGLQKLTVKLVADNARAATTQLELFAALVEQLSVHAKAFFTDVKALREEDDKRGSGTVLSYATELWLSPELRASLRWQTCEASGASLARVFGELSAAGKDLVAKMTHGLDTVPKEERGDALPDFVGLLMGLDAQAQALEQILDAPNPELVYTVHVTAGQGRGRGQGQGQGRGRGARQFVELSIEQLSVADRLADELYTRTNSVVYSSATLAVGESFERFARGVGLDRLDPEEWSTLRLDSSFDLPAQMRVFVARDLPQPNDPACRSALGKLLLQTHLALGGGVLTLFTNNRDLSELYRALKPQLESAGIPLLSQSAGYSRQAISDTFLRDPRASLFATKSFWEGFDAPGDTLRCVIIPKLPFARPNDPLSQARRAAEGSGAWGRYDLPDAVIELKQATGRLIRSAADEGFVILGDSRLLTKGYGKTILASLPVEPEPLTCAEIITQLKQH
ncbi:MAG: exonuclease domain-containing protein [Coriobacteriia bacterium]|nr:exonuclease domain-containing protein [Coriobacteriia bacterium]